MHLTVLGEQNVLLKLYNTEYSRYIYFFFHFSEANIRQPFKTIGGWKRNHESWIIVTKHVRIMNFCFKNLGIMNLCTSARESWVTRLWSWERLNKIQYELIAFDPVNAGYGVSEGPIFKHFSGGACPRTPCITHAFRADSPLVSTVIWCLMQLQKNSIPSWTKRMMIPSLDETELWTPKKHYKTRLSCHWENH